MGGLHRVAWQPKFEAKGSDESVTVLGVSPFGRARITSYRIGSRSPAAAPEADLNVGEERLRTQSSSKRERKALPSEP